MNRPLTIFLLAFTILAGLCLFLSGEVAAQRLPEPYYIITPSPSPSPSPTPLPTPTWTPSPTRGSALVLGGPMFAETIAEFDLMALARLVLVVLGIVWVVVLLFYANRHFAEKSKKTVTWPLKL